MIKFARRVIGGRFPFVTQFTDKLRTTAGARKLGPGPEATPDKTLRIFVTLEAGPGRRWFKSTRPPTKLLGLLSALRAHPYLAFELYARLLPVIEAVIANDGAI